MPDGVVLDVRAAVVVLALLVGVPVALAADPATQTKPYVAAGGDAVVDCSREIGTGGACFVLDGSESQVSLRIQDDRWPRMGGYWSFRDGPNTSVSAEIRGGDFCIETVQVVPYGAKALLVYVDQARTPLHCSFTAVGTTGAVTAAFT